MPRIIFVAVLTDSSELFSSRGLHCGGQLILDVLQGPKVWTKT